MQPLFTKSQLSLIRGIAHAMFVQGMAVGIRTEEYPTGKAVQNRFEELWVDFVSRIEGADQMESS